MTMPTEAATIGSMLLAAANRYGDRPALIVYDEGCSFRALAEGAQAIAGLLQASGLRPGDHLAVWLPNGREFVELVFGASLAGVVVVPLNTRLKRTDAVYALKTSKTRALFFSESFLGIDFYALVGEMLDSDEMPDLDLVVNLGGRSDNRIASFAGWRDGLDPVRTLPPVDPQAIAFISFTSGTTSRPKGAMIAHHTLLHIAREVGARMGIGEGDRVASAMPFYHNGGFVPTLLSGLMGGAVLYTQPRFDPDYVLEVIAREKCTVVSGAGTMFTMMLDSPAMTAADLSSVRAVRITGPADMRRAVQRRFGDPMIFSLYGMSETTAAVTVTCPGDTIDEQLNTNGKALPGVSIRIAAADGSEVPVGTQGEIWIGGRECLMKGYFGDTTATAAVLCGGWMRSGDIGYIDEQGNLVLVGRMKDMYRTGGENVACAEVEEFLREHHAVLHAVIMGVPDPRMDEVGFAFIQLRPGMTTTAEELQQFCKDHLANFKVPRYVHFVESLPITITGRVEKHKLRDRAVALAVEG